MPKITYIEANGVETVVQAESGISLMQAAVNNNVRGIVGECGGACSCASCHVFIDAPWDRLLHPIGDMEESMLECTAAPRQGTSRLGCEIQIGPELDGLVVHLPAKQF
jgi:2Fe-2S ferredoxin